MFLIAKLTLRFLALDNPNDNTYKLKKEERVGPVISKHDLGEALVSVLLTDEWLNSKVGIGYWWQPLFVQNRHKICNLSLFSSWCENESNELHQPFVHYNLKLKLSNISFNQLIVTLSY